jgi:hypothetical protein
MIQVLSPALAGIELIPASVLMKNVADSSGKSLSSVKSAVAAAGGDVGPVAQSLQGSQMRLFQPPRLSFATAFAKMREIALMGGRDVAKKQEQARLLMLAAQGPEILTIVRCLQGTLRRSGYSTSAVVSALAKAVEMHPIEQPRAEIPASADANAQAQPRDGEDEVCVGGAEEIEGIIHEALSHVPSLERVVAALLEKGPHSLMAALGVTVRRGAGTRARKAKQAAFQNLRDDIEFEMAEEGWLHASGLEQGAKEIELEELKAASAAAVLSGLSPRHLTSHEEMVLPPALAQDSARAVALRNHILLRHRRHTLSSLEYQPLTEEQACAVSRSQHLILLLLLLLLSLLLLLLLLLPLLLLLLQLRLPFLNSCVVAVPGRRSSQCRGLQSCLCISLQPGLYQPGRQPHPSSDAGSLLHRDHQAACGRRGGWFCRRVHC